MAHHRLSASRSREIFTTQILPVDIEPVPACDGRPLAILAVGQTGAGKTRLVPAILSALAASNRTPVHLIADVYKTHHPSYHSLPAHLASSATSADARIWLTMAAEEASRRKQDVVVESACRHPEDFSGLASIFSSASYYVIVVVLAVPYPLSRLGILARYFHRRPEGQSRGMPLRLTPEKVHDESYEGLMSAAEWLDESAVADQVVVVRRGNHVGYLGTGGVAAALRIERERPLTEGERRAAEEDVRGLLGVDGAEEKLSAIRGQLDALLGRDGAAGVFPPLRNLEFEDEVDENGTTILRAKG